MQQAASVTVAAVAVPLLVKAAKTVKYKWDKYAAAQIEEIRQIRMAYREKCSKEKHHTLSTFNISEHQSTSVSPEVTEFPIYLRTKNNDELPELFEQGFRPLINLEDWRKHLSEDSPLGHPIEEAIAYICIYQKERDARIIGSGYNYDPTNMFFEELKCWFVALSREKELNQKVLEIAKGRYEYLGEIYAKGVFDPGEGYTRVTALKYLRDIFKNVIIPSIELSISRVSAREQFDTLKRQIKSRIRLSIEFLFYVFRNTDATPDFVVDEIRYPSLDAYKRVVNGTTSGKLLQHLLNTDLMKYVLETHRDGAGLHSLPQAEGTSADQSEQLDFLNRFIDQDEKLVYPFRTSSTNARNWYESTEEGHNVSGVLSVFREDPEAMRKFLYLHGLIQKLCIFYVICEKLYELSGDGGNILVYGFALNQVNAVLQEYKSLNRKLCSTVDYLFGKAESHKATLQTKADQTKFAAWNGLFYHIYVTHEKLGSIAGENISLILQIEQKIVEVNSEKYKQNFRKRLDFLFLLVDQFTGKKKSSDAVVLRDSGMGVFLEGSPPQRQLPQRAESFEETYARLRNGRTLEEVRRDVTGPTSLPASITGSPVKKK